MVQYFTGLYDVAVDPFDPYRLLLADHVALYLVADDGIRMKVAPTGPAVFDPVRPGVVYWSTWDAIRRSEDHGTTWRTVASDPRVEVLSVGGSGVVYGRGGLGVARSTDGGRTWATFSTGLFAAPIDRLLVVPASPTVVYSLGLGLQRTMSDGRHWRSLGRDFDYSSIVGIAADPSDPAVVYAATGEGVGRCCSVAKSTDFGTTWRFVEIPGAWEGVDYGVAVDPRDPKIVYAGISQDWRGGVARSDDGGRTWRDFYDQSGFRVAAWVIDPIHAGRVFVATRNGVFVSEDFGETWTRSSQGLPEASGATSLAMSPLDANVLYAGVSPCCGFDVGHGIYRSEDAGRSWQPRGLEGEHVRAILPDPSSPLRVWVGTSGGVFASDDEGGTWNPLNGGLEASQVTSLGLASGRLYAATDGGIYRLGAPVTPSPRRSDCRADLRKQAGLLERKAGRALRRCLHRLAGAEDAPDAGSKCERLLDIAHDGTLVAPARARRSARLARRCHGVDVYDLDGLITPHPATVTDAIDHVLDASLRRALAESGSDTCAVLRSVGLGRACERP